MRGEKRLDAPKLWIVLARCYRALATLAERSIADLRLCLSDFMVLEALLHKGPLTISEIQVKVLLASGSMTAAVDRLESMGLVVRKTTAKDRRAPPRTDCGGSAADPESLRGACSASRKGHVDFDGSGETVPLRRIKESGAFGGRGARPTALGKRRQIDEV